MEGESGAAIGLDGAGKPNPPPKSPRPPGITASIILPLTFSIIASLRMNT